MAIQNKMQDNDTTASTVPSENSKSERHLATAHDFMNLALVSLKEESIGSREKSLAVTKLEEAMMWNNKDRTIRGFLKPYNTHA